MTPRKERKLSGYQTLLMVREDASKPASVGADGRGGAAIVKRDSPPPCLS